MAAIKRNDRGKVKVSNSVIAKIAGYATTACYGVVGMATKSSKDGVSRLLKMENMDKGIKVKTENNSINIYLYIIVGYGVNIRSIGETIRSSVRYQVERAIGMTIGDIVVNVEGVRE